MDMLKVIEMDFGKLSLLVYLMILWLESEKGFQLESWLEMLMEKNSEVENAPQLEYLMVLWLEIEMVF